MKTNDLFTVLDGIYHDGALCDAKYENNTLFLNIYHFLYDENCKPCGSQNVIVRFDNASELQVYDYDNHTYVPYKDGDFVLQEGVDAISPIDGLDYEDGFIIFEECIRFKADNANVLAVSDDELLLSDYCK